MKIKVITSIFEDILIFSIIKFGPIILVLKNIHKIKKYMLISLDLSKIDRVDLILGYYLYVAILILVLIQFRSD